MAKHDYSMSDGGDSSGTHGKGGVHAAAKRNPNKVVNLNDTPCGPYAHAMGYDGDGGMQGDASVGFRGRTYYFK